MERNFKQALDLMCVLQLLGVENVLPQSEQLYSQMSAKMSFEVAEQLLVFLTDAAPI